MMEERRRRRLWKWHAHSPAKKKTKNHLILGEKTKISECWKIVKGREAWHAAVHGVTKHQTQLSN